MSIKLTCMKRRDWRMLIFRLQKHLDDISLSRSIYIESEKARRFILAFFAYFYSALQFASILELEFDSDKKKTSRRNS